jgi:hypothetical protein
VVKKRKTEEKPENRRKTEEKPVFTGLPKKNRSGRKTGLHETTTLEK